MTPTPQQISLFEPPAPPSSAGVPADLVVTDAAARTRIATDLDHTLFVEAGAGSGKTTALVDRVVALVRRGVPMGEIAAITFTEKAAAELRTRIRQRLEEVADPDATIAAALAALDGSAIGTLHAFAQRILTEHPVEAGIPPRVQVLDEISSTVAFEARWSRFVDTFLDDPTQAHTILTALACGITVRQLRDMALALSQNWDLLEDRLTRAMPPEPDTDVSSFFIAADAVLGGLAATCTNPDDKLARHIVETIVPTIDGIRHHDDDLERIGMLINLELKTGSGGTKANWAGNDPKAVRDEIRTVAEHGRAAAAVVAQACLERLLYVVGRFTLDAATERRAAGELEFHDLLVMARDLVRGRNGVTVRAALRTRYSRLLLDEFQDTDPIQLELAVLIASADPDAGSKPWDQINTDPGRLFFVGDPKQSIYRFRRADIALFLAARDRFAADGALSLTMNFRTGAPTLAWVNGVFRRLIRHVPDEQPEYVALDAARPMPPVGPAVMLLGTDQHPKATKAAEIRTAEAAEVADTVVQAIVDQWSVRDGEAWRPARLGDICILLPARTSLPQLQKALDEQDIPYRAETSSLVYATREIRDLFAALRCIDDPSDELSLIAALRSTLFGCGDDDLWVWKASGGRWQPTAPRPDGIAPDHPVAEAMTVLGELHRERNFLTASALIDRLLRDRRVFELALTGRRHRDLWRRLRFVVDQARGFAEAEGGGLRAFVTWATRQANETGRAKETILPETDDDAVRIMTIHASKGLEFPIVIVSGLSTQPGGSHASVVVSFPRDSEHIGVKLSKGVRNDVFEANVPVDEQLDHQERFRLLYVATTRAQDHLVVSVHRKESSGRDLDPKRQTGAELLSLESDEIPETWVTFTPSDSSHVLPPAAASADVAPLVPYDQWHATRIAALARSSRSSTVAATTLARDAVRTDRDDPTTGLVDPRPHDDNDPGPTPPPADDEVEFDNDFVADLADDPGLDKDSRDLDLPAWQRGRYGTAIGRAVHAVLQTVDLATGAGLTAAANGQAAAEGILGQERVIEALARAALDSTTVQAAAATEHWREVYVAAPIDNRLLEGYIDLLYRTPDGLVVVDYKTDLVTDDADVDAKLDRYRLQGAAYAAAVAEVTGEVVHECRFVFCTPTGPIERTLADLSGAVATVRQTMAAAD